MEVKVMGEAAMKLEEKYTYGDYAQWPEGERWELINGTAYAMSPAPRLRHQDLLSGLHSIVSAYFKGKNCNAFFSPVDVFWPQRLDQPMKEVDTVTQPDLLVVCDKNKFREEGIWGAPDWIVEILSPSTASKDLTEKRDLHEAHGVREYWVVNYSTLEVLVYTLTEDGSYGLPVGQSLKTGASSGLFPGLEIRVNPEDLVP